MSSFTAVNAQGVPRTPPPEAAPGPAISQAPDADPAISPDVAPATPPDIAPAIPPDVTPATAHGVVPTTEPRRMLRSGAYKAVSDAFLNMCETYLASDRPRTMQASAKAAIKRYDDGDLSAKQLADFISAFYEAISDHQDVCQEQAAWLSDVERKKDHWKKLGYAEYEDYLSAIDPQGKARNMICMHHETVRRKTNAINTVRECWAGSPELLELLTMGDGESKWVGLAGLAKATDGAPEVAKYSLNQAILTRIRSGKTGRGAVRTFVLSDFIAARKSAETIDQEDCPWDKEEYEGIAGLKMKLYRGVLLSKKRYPGKEDSRSARQIDQAVDASSSSAVMPSCERGTSPREERGTPPREIASTPAPVPVVPPSTPVSLLRRRALTAFPATLAGDKEVPEDGTPSPTITRRSQRKRNEQDAAFRANFDTPSPTITRRSQRMQNEQAAEFRARFGITDPELSPGSRFSFDDALEEVTGGRAQEWKDKKEIGLQGCLDWLLKDDKEVVEMLSYERQLIKHHNGNKEPYEFPMSLAHQAARQDPGLYLIALACLGNSLVVSVPFKGEGSLFVELDLDDPAGNIRLACQPSTPTGGRRLSLGWAAVSKDGVRIKDSAKSSWGKYVVAHAQAGVGDIPGGFQVRSASALGSAMLCQLSFSTPAVRQNGAVIGCDDRALAHNVIQRTRMEILRQLKAAFRELVMTEQFYHQGDALYHQGDAYYPTTSGTKRAANGTAGDDDPKGKRLKSQSSTGNKSDTGNSPKGMRLRSHK